MAASAASGRMAVSARGGVMTNSSGGIGRVFLGIASSEKDARIASAGTRGEAASVGEGGITASAG